MARREQFDMGFARQAQAFTDQTNAVGGGTIHPTSLGIPQIGETGWMVGGHPDSSGKRIPERTVSAPLSAHEAASHIVKTAIATGGDKTGYAGSWVNDEGKIALDASTRVDGRRAARRLGNQRNEDAIFGLQNATTTNVRVGRAKARAAKGA